MATDELGRSVRVLQRQLLQSSRQDSRFNTQQQALQPQAQPIAPAPEDDYAIDFGTDPTTGLPLTERDYEPGVVHAIKSIGKATRKELADLKKKVAAYEQIEQTRATERLTREIDAGFADVADLEKFIGKGSRADLTESDAAYHLRLAVVQSLVTNPIKGASPRKAIAQRAREMFGGSGRAAEPPEPAAPSPRSQAAQERPREPNGRFTREQWNEGALARPTQRSGAAEPNGVEKAVRGVEQLFREAGGAENVELTDDEFIP